MARISFLILTAVVLIRGDGHGDNPCEHGGDELGSCLNFIREVSLDTDKFWFGNSYATKCGDAPSSDVECTNTMGYSGRSLLSLMFSEGASELDDLDRFLSVRYETEDFHYHGCDTDVHQPATSFDLDMSFKEQLPASARDMPDLQWNYEAGDLFTVMMVDPGFAVAHALYINVEENGKEKRETIIDYSGPLNPRFTPNVYVWLVFRQPGRITWLDEWTTRLEPGVFVPSLSDFKSAYELTGPIAMNMMLISTDIYAVSTLGQLYPFALQYCSAFVEKGLLKQEDAFLPDEAELTAYLYVVVESDDFEFYYCCEPHYYAAEYYVVNPLSEDLVRPATVRTGSHLHFYLNATGAPPMISNFEDKYYVMVAVDPDVPNPMVGTSGRPLIHYFAYNMQVQPTSSYTGMVTELSESRYWRGPAPPDAATHTYYFLMYEQNEWWSGDELWEYTEDENCFDAQRCLFEIDRYVADKQLKLVAASWMHARNDDYVNFMRGLPEDQVCGDRYPCPMPPSGASRMDVQMSVLTVLVCWLVAVIN